MIQIRMILKLVLILGLMLLLGWRIHWRREKPQTSFSFSCAIIMSIHCDSYHHHHQHKKSHSVIVHGMINQREAGRYVLL